MHDLDSQAVSMLKSGHPIVLSRLRSHLMRHAFTEYSMSGCYKGFASTRIRIGLLISDLNECVLLIWKLGGWTGDISALALFRGCMRLEAGGSHVSHALCLSTPAVVNSSCH
jgi:hypothetical protein